jgi:hypothetical protein
VNKVLKYYAELCERWQQELLDAGVNHDKVQEANASAKYEYHEYLESIDKGKRRYENTLKEALDGNIAGTTRPKLVKAVALRQIVNYGLAKFKNDI